ncbi:hypothetical protein [Paenibacillus radicis (ex Gao et al. 2016)]|uniref:Uncharacterized protein n=1 Tax=Paenibacillus radicis (ex Gao et al. 2016) TaxID=1737354 RepID=A0A917GQH9_9BACL|nr:hypothetical protein [Paenibacillus radicis (ex Gao et al. 2016)]GGG53593.1 hypothetical protein GCM10010918_02890 [Paenibacillus radicis (ex Gao et al. 2016)]
MINAYKRCVIVLLIIVALFMFWNSFRSSTMEVVIIQKVSKNEITIKNLGDRVRTIKVPIDISKLVEENKQYAISYDKRILDNYRINYISAQLP